MRTDHPEAPDDHFVMQNDHPKAPDGHLTMRNDRAKPPGGHLMVKNDQPEPPDGFAQCKMIDRGDLLTPTVDHCKPFVAYGVQMTEYP